MSERLKPRRVEQFPKRHGSSRLATLLFMATALGFPKYSLASEDRTLDQQCGLDPIEAAPLMKSAKEIVEESAKNVALHLLTEREINGPVVERIITDETTKVILEHLTPPFAEKIQQKKYLEAADYTEKYNCLYTAAEISIQHGEKIRKQTRAFLQEKLGDQLGAAVWEAIQRDFGEEMIEKKLLQLLDHAGEVFWNEIQRIITIDLEKRVKNNDLTKSKGDQEYVEYFSFNPKLPRFLKNETVRLWFVDLMRMNVLKWLSDKKSTSIGGYEWVYKHWTQNLPGLQEAVQRDQEVQNIVMHRLLTVNRLYGFNDELGYAKEFIHFNQDQKKQLLKKLDSFRPSADKFEKMEITACEKNISG